jgi:hypothetical protein
MRFTRTFGYPTDVIEERFWAKVEKTDDCWMWTGMKDGSGYGRMQVKPSTRSHHTMPAHRVAYQLLVGPIPADMTIDHLCRVKACVNPAHLDVVSVHENGRRGYEAQHAKTGQCRVCSLPIIPTYIFCRGCWMGLPEEHRLAINSKFVPGIPPAQQTDPAYWAAVEAAR